ncbi:MAG: hypothetical protein HY369_00520 [Candidatus Aenigmarchaeota archaeon]|nr:hypothetical protein [Candidatus Aenigmarchaeota archaeon]
MTERDFCYWLQGFIELTGHDHLQAFTPDQVQSIQKHMDLVKANEKTASEVCAWIRGALAVGGENAVSLIAAKLGDHFEHVIDKQYENQPMLNNIHNPGQHPGKPGYRC